MRSSRGGGGAMPLLCGLLLLGLQGVAGFVFPVRHYGFEEVARSSSSVRGRSAWRLASSGVQGEKAEVGASKVQDTIQDRLSREWELDCYSRPVLGEDGKKLWELLICDALGQHRVVERLPSNMVNSRELRKLVEKAIDEAEVKPRVIRFFRNAMYNMINLALKDLKVRVVASRSTNALYAWLDEREEEVYSKMPSYDPNMKESADVFSLREPEQMPPGLMGEKYAFMCLPASHFLDGSINYENMGIGRLAPMPKSIKPDQMVQGIVIYSSRARSIAAWLNSMETCFIRANFSKRMLLLEVGIDTQYLFATLNDVRRVEAQIFEKGKEELGGLHFVALQEDEDCEDVQGFFLLRERKQR